MQASLRDSDIVRRPWEWRPRAPIDILRSQELYDAVIQSAAVYSVASFSLPVTFLIDTNLMFYVNMSILSPLMVRNDAFQATIMGSALTIPPQGIAFSLAVIDRGGSAPNGLNQQYVPWTQQSQGRPPMPDTGYISLTAPLERSPDLA